MINSKQKNARRLLVAVNKIDEAYYAFGKSCDVKENTLFLLYAMADQVPRTQKQICAEWLIPKTTLNTAVRECTQAGYIQRLAGEDGREKLLTLTEAGREYAGRVLKPLARIEETAIEKTLRQFSPEFIKALELYAESLQKEIRKPSSPEGR